MKLWCDCFTPEPYVSPWHDTSHLPAFRDLRLQRVDIDTLTADMHLERSIVPLPLEAEALTAREYIERRRQSASILIPELQQRLQQRQHLHRTRQEELILRRAHWSGKVQCYKAGDMVLVSWKPERTGLNATFRGPFMVQRITANGNIIIRGAAAPGENAPTWSVKPQRLLPYHYNFQCVDPRDAELEHQFQVSALPVTPAGLGAGTDVHPLVQAAFFFAQPPRFMPHTTSAPAASVSSVSLSAVASDTPRVSLPLPCAHFDY
jgi:hypothetical protein